MSAHRPEAAEVATDPAVILHRLDGDPAAVRTARRLVSDSLTEWGRADLIDDAVLVTSELVSSALMHGAPPVVITVTGGTTPTVEVSDSSPQQPVKRLPGSAGHFGMWLACELADLTVVTSPEGKTIRATFGA